jgi:hypothetical protein
LFAASLADHVGEHHHLPPLALADLAQLNIKHLRGSSKSSSSSSNSSSNSRGRGSSSSSRCSIEDLAQLNIKHLRGGSSSRRYMHILDVTCTGINKDM